jgi:putative Mg2+ transporter-C (MgtC) family protein
MSDWQHYLLSLPWELAGQLTLAALLGGLIGFEREWTAHPAGLRTNILVAVGSCLFTVLSIHAFPLRGTAQDTARIAAQIVTGVGFLGAGALFQTRNQVKGLTTAATIWLVAAIGMAAGTGLYFVAIFTTVLAVVVLTLLKPVSDRLPRRPRSDDDVRRKRPKMAQRAPGDYYQPPRDDSVE